MCWSAGERLVASTCTSLTRDCALLVSVGRMIRALPPLRFAFFLPSSGCILSGFVFPVLPVSLLPNVPPPLPADETVADETRRGLGVKCGLSAQPLIQVGIRVA